jgi:hypothetical protein
VLAGQKLGIKEVDEGIWLASFMHYDLCYFDLEQKTLQPLDNPFGTRLSPNSRTIRLVDNARLVNQIAALERRTSRGGKDTIDHSPGAHDDVANVVAGLAHCAINQHSASITELRI